MKPFRQPLNRESKKSRGLLAFGCLLLAIGGGAAPSFADTVAAGALPTGGTVTSGNASIASVGSQMDIHQTTDRASVNWDRFDVGSAAEVRFHQPSASAQTLNRVLSSDASRIMGRVSANGQIILINPNGIVFGAGSQVNAASLVASTLAITDEDFQGGVGYFEQKNGAGNITNEGTLTATDGGTVALVAGKITNNGRIVAPNGKAVLAAGGKVMVPLTDSGLITMDIAAGAIGAQVENAEDGSIEAAGGEVYLAAEASGESAAQVINKGDIQGETVRMDTAGSAFLEKDSQVLARHIHVDAGAVLGSGNLTASGEGASVDIGASYVSLTGAVRADNAQGTGGDVRITAGDSLMLAGSSRISANGKTGGTVALTSNRGLVLVSGSVEAQGSEQKGGTIDLSGYRSTTLLGASLQASGQTGGGVIHLGGGWHGTGDLVVSQTMTMDAASVVAADALVAGKGGDVVLWSSVATNLYGTINARGGVQSGDGGNVELSSAGTLNAYLSTTRGVNVLARGAGANGMITMDPANIVIGETVGAFDLFKTLLSNVGTATTGGAPEGVPGGNLGISVALNGSYALIGSYGVNFYRGTAYLYNLASGTWTDMATTPGQPVTGLLVVSYFGASVALNDTYALMGAYGVSSSRGNAFLYNLATGAWTTLSSTAGQPITALGSNSLFGNAVALNNTHALIGAWGVSTNRGNAYLYNLGTGAWTTLSTTAGQPITALAASSRFGSGVALNAAYALIGAEGISSNRGGAYLYNLGTGAWTSLAGTANQPITALAGSSRFGASVALNSTHALMGAPGVSSSRGNAFLYTLAGGAWLDLATSAGEPVTGLAASAAFGTAVALNSTHALIGASGVSASRGQAYFYKIADGTWTAVSDQADSPLLTQYNSSSFGKSVALSETYALVGASTLLSSQGAVYLYSLTTGAWSNMGTGLWNPGVSEADTWSYLGDAAAMSDRYVLLGDYSVNMGLGTRAGGAYLYDRQTGVWTDLATTPGQPITQMNSFAYFGNAVALNSTYALIGAPGYASSRGAAYLYHLATGVWTDMATLPGQPITGLVSASFGGSLALTETVALLGSSEASSRGNAYLYHFGTGAWTNLATTEGQPITALASASFFSTTLAINDHYALFSAQLVATNRGNAYLYDYIHGGWTDLATTDGQPITALLANSYFGSGVALNGSYALIGARGAGFYRGNAYLYHIETGTWTDMATTAGNPIAALLMGMQLGRGVGLNTTYALLGLESGNETRGNVYLYHLGNGAWTNLAEETPEFFDSLPVAMYLGDVIAMTETHAYVGSSWMDGSYIFDLTARTWQDILHDGVFYDGLKRASNFGMSLALSETYALIYASRSPYLYHLGTGVWTDLSATDSTFSSVITGSNNFGLSVAINADYALFGNRSAASLRGDAYLYHLATNTWTTLSETAGQPITALAGSSSFGVNVNLSDTYAIIGATGVSGNKGNAYLYHLGTGAWTDLSTTAGQPITALAANAYFGNAVALNSTYALIGAYGVSSSRGNAYLYNIGTGAWTNLATTAGQPITALASSAYFANCVALNEAYAALGAPGVSSSRGNAFLYNLGTGAWTNLATTAGQPITGLGSYSSAGRTVALSATLFLMNGNMNNAYTYNLSSGAWINLGTRPGSSLNLVNTKSSIYGAREVAINSTYVLLGLSAMFNEAGNAYLYNIGSGVWTDLSTTAKQPILGVGPTMGAFGSSVAMADNVAIIGASGVLAGRGNAFLYDLTTGAWTDLAATSYQPVTALASGSGFGSSVAISDGYALIGASGVAASRGEAFLFNLASRAWTSLASTAGEPVTGLTAGAQFGSSVALNDNYALIGAAGAGGGYLYHLAQHSWTDLAGTGNAPLAAMGAGTQFGSSVALNSVYALIGASGLTGGRGGAYLYALGTGAWTDLATTAGQPVTALGAASAFGSGVALNESYALLAAQGVAAGRGNAYLYHLTTGAWTDLATSAGQPVTALGAASAFGSGVALNESYALIGASGVSSSRGNAYLYHLTTGAWTDMATMTGQPITALAANSLFGTSVALNARYALVGASGAFGNQGTAITLDLRNALASRISSATIQAALAGGNYTIIADNDLIIESLRLTSANAGNSLTLKAGRSLLVEGVAILGGRTTVMTANAANADLGAASSREAGAASLTLETGALIDNAGGALTMRINASSTTGRAGLFATAGDINLAAPISAGSVLIEGAESAIDLSAPMVASAAGQAITLYAEEERIFGNGSLSAASGFWRVYNGRADALGTVNLGVASRDFNRYGCAYGGACADGVSVPAAGNGVIYAFAPTLTVTDFGDVDKVYDGTTNVDLTGAVITGFVNGDVLQLAGNYTSRNVGQAVSVSYTLSEAWGYVLNPAALSGAITPATLTVDGVAAFDKIYDATTLAALNVTGASLNGVIGADDVSVLSGAGVFANKNAETGKAVTATVLTLAGDDAGNYTVTLPVGLSATISPKEITYAIADAQSRAGTMPVLGNLAFTGVYAGDIVRGNILLSDALGVDVVTSPALPVGTYTQRLSDFGGTDSGNYSVASVGNRQGLFTYQAASFPKPVTLTAAVISVVGASSTEEETTNGGATLVAASPPLLPVVPQSLVPTAPLETVLYLSYTKQDLAQGVALLQDMQKSNPDIVAISSFMVPEREGVATLSYDVQSGLMQGSPEKDEQEAIVQVQEREGGLRRYRLYLAPFVLSGFTGLSDVASSP